MAAAVVPEVLANTFEITENLAVEGGGGWNILSVM